MFRSNTGVPWFTGTAIIINFFLMAQYKWFPDHDEDTFEPDAPWEDGRVFSMELQATNSPGEINFEEYEPYDEEASQRVIADLQRSIAGLAWR